MSVPADQVSSYSSSYSNGPGSDTGNSGGRSGGSGSGSGGQSGSQPTWQQLQALVSPPALTTQEADTLEFQAPVPPDLGPTPTQAAADQADANAQEQTLTDMVAQDKKFSQQYQQDLSASEAQEQAVANAEANALEQPPPAPPTPDANPLQRMAPLLLLSAFGGRATKMDAGLMLAASTGIVNGYLKGDQQKYDNSVKQYDEAYKQFTDRQNDQVKIADALKKAYAGAPDAELKAWQMAHTMTNDDLKLDQQRVEIQDKMQAATDALKKNKFEMDEQAYGKRVQIELAKRKAQQTAAQNQGGGLPAGFSLQDVQTVAGALKKSGINVPGGMSGKAVISNTTPFIADTPRKPGENIQTYAARVAQEALSGRAGQRAQLTEAGTVAKREANIDAALQSLIRQPNGVFDILDQAAKKVNLGSNKIQNAIKVGIANGVYANNDIRAYVTTLEDARSDMASVLARGGTQTDQNRFQARQQLPDNMSYSELQTAIAQSRKVALAIRAGNQDVISAVESGKPISDAAQYATPARGTVSAGTVQQYADKHGMSEQAAEQFLKSQGYQVQ